MMIKDWAHKKVVVIGAARQGLALARYLLLHGAQVVLNDRRSLEDLVEAQETLSDLSGLLSNLTWVCGGHPLELLDEAEIVFISGGVPLDLPVILEAGRRGMQLSNDSQLFLEVAPCTVVGITGSAGKTTTTSLVGRIAAASVSQTIQSGYRQAWVGGNIGSPLISVIDQMDAADIAIMELSSFQLEIMTISPHIATILNITPNHLDRHESMQAYVNAKSRILLNQTSTDVAVLCRDDPIAWSLRQKVNGKLYSFGRSELAPGQMGVYLQDDNIIFRAEADHEVLSLADIQLRGEHNVLNVMAACTIAMSAGLSVEAVRKGVRGFTGAPHRLEFVRNWGGADWYNDSIATAPERSMAAIRSFQEPLVLLAGGRDKNLPWREFAELVNQRVRFLVIFGEAAPLIKKAMDESGFNKTKVVQSPGLKQAVSIAAQEVQTGDVVLLAPGGTSFDEFKDFEERGRCFVQWVKDLP